MNQMKTRKLGRNDPCHCGSGRKYKDCHLRIEEEWRSQQLRLRNAQDQLLQRILAMASTADATDLQIAFDRYWQQRYQFAQLAELNQRESYGADRFMVWFAFDYRQPDGKTLVERLAAQEQRAIFPLLNVNSYRPGLMSGYDRTALRNSIRMPVPVCATY